MIKLIFGGISGKTGKMVAEKLSQNESVEIVAGIGRKTVGVDIGDLIHNKNNGKYIHRSLQDCIDCENADLFIDFSTREAAPSNIECALKNRISTIVGTTGIEQQEIERLSAIAEENNVFILFSSNFSLSMAWLSNSLSALSKIYDKENIGIIEVHHSDKEDKPSGTALYLKDKIGINTNENINSLRIPMKISKHSIFATGLGDNILIEHTVFNSITFVEGLLFVINNYQNSTGVYTDLASFLSDIEKLAFR